MAAALISCPGSPTSGRRTQHHAGLVLRSGLTPGCRASPTNVACAAQASNFPHFIPQEKANEITSPQARAMLMNYERCEMEVAGLPPLQTSYVGPNLQSQSKHETDTYAVDLIGCGLDDTGGIFQMLEIRMQLYEFWKAKIGRPIVVLGASLGGTVALDFAATYPEAVSSVVLVAAQGYIDGIGPASKAPRFITSLGIKFLGSYPLRRNATGLGFVDKEQYSTEDAVRIGRIHTYDQGWEAAKLAFISSGGYQSISKQIRQLEKPSLLLWGRQDEILDPKYYDMFMNDLQDVTGHLLNGCGHFMVIEKPKECADIILDFIDSAVTSTSPSNTVTGSI